jgi:hypothetical protein
MDASLRVGAAVIWLLLMLAFLQSAARVALVNSPPWDLVGATRRQARPYDIRTPGAEAAEI